MWIINRDDEFYKIDKTDPLYEFYQCTQELQLWAGENPLDTTQGIDYFAVFNGTQLYEAQLEKVLQKYRASFNSIEIISMDKDDESINVVLLFVLKDNSSVKATIKQGLFSMGLPI